MAGWYNSRTGNQSEVREIFLLLENVEGVPDVFFEVIPIEAKFPTGSHGRSCEGGVLE